MLNIWWEAKIRPTCHSIQATKHNSFSIIKKEKKELNGGTSKSPDFGILLLENFVLKIYLFERMSDRGSRRHPEIEAFQFIEDFCYTRNQF